MKAKPSEKKTSARDAFLDKLTTATVRSKGQTLFLLELLDNDLFKLMELEEKLMNNFLHYCPGDREECQRVLSMDNGSGWFSLSFTYSYKEKEKVEVEKLEKFEKPILEKFEKPTKKNKVITEADLRNVAKTIVENRIMNCPAGKYR